MGILNKPFYAEVYIELTSGEEYNIEVVCKNDREYSDLERTVSNFTSGILYLRNAVSSATIRGEKRRSSVKKGKFV